MSEKIYKRILEKKKELDDELSNNKLKTVKYYPFILKETEQKGEKKRMKELLGRDYVQFESKKVLEGRKPIALFMSFPQKINI